MFATPSSSTRYAVICWQVRAVQDTASDVAEAIALISVTGCGSVKSRIRFNVNNILLIDNTTVFVIKGAECICKRVCTCLLVCARLRVYVSGVLVRDNVNMLCMRVCT